MEEKHSQGEAEGKNSRKLHMIKRERELRGWSQIELADKIGTEPRSIRRWEQGENFPTPHMRERLIEIFGMNAQELGLIDGEEEIYQKSQPSDAPTQRMAGVSSEERITKNIRLYLAIITSTLFFISVIGCVIVFYITRSLMPFIVPILVIVPMIQVIAYYFPSQKLKNHF